MRDMVLLVVAGMLLGFLGATTLVVVRAGGDHTGRITSGDPLEAVAADPVDPPPADTSAVILPDSSAGVLTAVSDPVPAPPVALADSLAPTVADGRGTPQEDELAAAAPVTTLPAGPMPGPADLARYLSTMQPRDAARVLEQMNDAEIARVLAMIGGRRASAIMGGLAPERAAAIGRLALANQNEEVS